jgi:hypothetical protein
MTLIFGGIDFPVFEMLFVVSFLLIIGLAITIFAIYYLIKELKLLKQLLSQEDTELGEFKSDLSQMNELKNSRDDRDANREVMDFVRANLNRGSSWEMIKSSLIAKGWPESELEKIYRKISR